MFESKVEANPEIVWTWNAWFMIYIADPIIQFISLYSIQFIQASIIEDRQTKRSKGCGIVTYQDPRDAARAIRELNESLLDGRKIFVQPDKGGGNNNNNYSTTNAPSQEDDNVVYVGNLDYDCTWQNLKDKFKPAGFIDKAEIVMGPNGKSKGFGKVVFSHPRDAQNAVRRFDGANFQGRALIVKPWGSSNNGGQDEPRGGGESSFKLHVGNLDFDCSPKDLRNLFARFGKIQVEIAQTKDGKSKGHATIVFGNPKDAQKALSQMDGSTFQGRPLKVKWDRDSSKPNESSSKRSSDKQQQHDDGLPNTTIFCGNLDFECRWQDLKDLFKKYGQVEHVEIAEHEDTKRSKGWGTVQFLTHSQATRAIEALDGTEFRSRKIQVKWDRKKGPAPVVEKEVEEPKKKPKKDQAEKKPKKQKPEPPAPTLDGALSASR